MEVWIPVLLFVIGFIALFVELFVPAAGVIGALGIICMIVGTILAYSRLGRVVGSIFLAGTLIGTPGMIVIGLKVFPNTFVGKKLILRETQQRDTGYTSYTGEKYDGLPGKQGTALTTLRPSGMTIIEGKKYSVVTAGEMIEKGETIKVVKVEGSRIVVKRVPKEKQDTA
jgi:membrane-bound serine protease (ClpP class)